MNWVSIEVEDFEYFGAVSPPHDVGYVLHQTAAMAAVVGEDSSMAQQNNTVAQQLLK